jgi:hypothetical protein
VLGHIIQFQLVFQNEEKHNFKKVYIFRVPKTGAYSWAPVPLKLEMKLEVRMKAIHQKIKKERRGPN